MTSLPPPRWPHPARRLTRPGYRVHGPISRVDGVDFTTASCRGRVVPLVPPALLGVL